jgi:hypothetical protein
MTLLLLTALAVASYQLGRLSRERGHLPPATRRAIRRDRRRQRLGLADVQAARSERPAEQPQATTPPSTTMVDLEANVGPSLGCRCNWGLGECRMCFEARTARSA